MKKKILLAVLVIAILLGAGFAYAYFATDTFRTEKEVFFSYILEDKMFEKLKHEKIVEYTEKQQNIPFTNKGKMTLTISGDMASADQEGLAMLNNSKISFEGKTDINKKIAEQNLNLNFAQAFTIPINLKLDNETIGVQSGFLSTKFIAVRNENLKALFEKLGLDSGEIPDKIEYTQEELTEEELQSLKDKYFAILNDNLEEELFSKEKADKQTIIKLKMPEKKFIDILVKILETARDDELLLSKMYGIYEREEIESLIDEEINELKEIETSDENTFEMDLYVQDKVIKKYEICAIEENEKTMVILIENTDSQIAMKLYNEEELAGELNISKETNENDAAYNISIKLYDEVDGDVEISLKMEYKNLLELDDVEEKFEIKMSYEETDEEGALTGEMTDMTVNFENITSFDSELAIDGLNEENAIILNDATEQELQNLILSIYQNLGLI